MLGTLQCFGSIKCGLDVGQNVFATYPVKKAGGLQQF